NTLQPEVAQDKGSKPYHSVAAFHSTTQLIPVRIQYTEPSRTSWPGRLKSGLKVTHAARRPRLRPRSSLQPTFARGPSQRHREEDPAARSGQPRPVQADEEQVPGDVLGVMGGAPGGNQGGRPS